MEPWKIDRTYLWLYEALNFNRDVTQKFFFDFEDKAFFRLKAEDNHFTTWPRVQVHLMREDERKTLLSKIEKVRGRSPDVLELKKFDDAFPYDRGKVRSEFEYKERMKFEQELFDKIVVFLDKYNIDITQCTLLE